MVHQDQLSIQINSFYWNELSNEGFQPSWNDERVTFSDSIIGYLFEIAINYV